MGIVRDFTNRQNRVTNKTVADFAATNMTITYGEWARTMGDVSAY